MSARVSRGPCRTHTANMCARSAGEVSPLKGVGEPSADQAGPLVTAKLYTLGHSTRSVEELEQLLRAYDIGVLADVRRFPRSRRDPQFDDQQLALALPEAGVRYVWMARLGGRRRSQAGGFTNGGWRNPSFRAFADYMLTEEFDRGLTELLDLTRTGSLAVMCAEAVPWRCHRSLIADALTVRGLTVCHIQSPMRAGPHRLTPFARVDGFRVTYPPLTDSLKSRVPPGGPLCPSAPPDPALSTA